MRSPGRLAAVLFLLSAAGCSGSGGTGSSGSSAGRPGATFTVSVRGDFYTRASPTVDPVFLVTGGRVESGQLTGDAFVRDGRIDCGLIGSTRYTSCSAEYAWGTTGVALRATVDPAKGISYFGFAGACTGEGYCALEGNADKMVLVRFLATRTGHVNFSDPAVHGPRYREFEAGAAGALRCTSCHGANLEGRGLAVACSGCHSWPLAAGGACTGGRLDCSGTCTEVAVDPMNCGACGQLCGIAHGTAVCGQGTCQVLGCDDEFMPVNGTCAGATLTLPDGSAVHVSPRDATGVLAGTFTDPSTADVARFMVNPTGPSSARAVYELGGVPPLTVILSDRTTVDVAFIGETFTGRGDLTAGQRAALEGLAGAPARALSRIPLELGCKSGLAESEAAALLVPLQLLLKHAAAGIAPPAVASALADLTCRYTASLGRPDERPRAAGDVGVGDAASFPHVLGFFPLDAIGAALGPLVCTSEFSDNPDTIDREVASNGSLCRGACGAGCDSDACTFECRAGNEILASCKTHEACRAHDQCYDDCDRMWGCLSTASLACKHGIERSPPSCDMQVVVHYGLKAGIEWARGRAPAQLPFDRAPKAFIFDLAEAGQTLQCTPGWVLPSIIVGTDLIDATASLITRIVNTSHAADPVALPGTACRIADGRNLLFGLDATGRAVHLGVTFPVALVPGSRAPTLELGADSTAVGLFLIALSGLVEDSGAAAVAEQWLRSQPEFPVLRDTIRGLVVRRGYLDPIQPEADAVLSILRTLAQRIVELVALPAPAPPDMGPCELRSQIGACYLPGKGIRVDWAPSADAPCRSGVMAFQNPNPHWTRIELGSDTILEQPSPTAAYLTPKDWVPDVAPGSIATGLLSYAQAWAEWSLDPVEFEEKQVDLTLPDGATELRIAAIDKDRRALIMNVAEGLRHLFPNLSLVTATADRIAQSQEVITAWESHRDDPVGFTAAIFQLARRAFLAEVVDSLAVEIAASGLSVGDDLLEDALLWPAFGAGLLKDAFYAAQLAHHASLDDVSRVTIPTSALFAPECQPGRQLLVQRQPMGGLSGQELPTQPVVSVMSASGELLSGSSAVVTASLASGTGVLTGTTSVAAVGGLATFADLAITGTGTFALAFTADGVIGVTSDPFSIALAPARYTVSATVTGLLGSGLVISNAFDDGSTEQLPVPGDGAFAFSTRGASGARYAVSVFTQPQAPTQRCAVASGTGVLDADVSNVVITCTTMGLATGPVLTSYPVGTGPMGIAHDAGTNSVWVANYHENTVTSLRVSDGALVGTFAVGKNPVGVAYDPVHQAVWVTNYSSNSVSKLDAATGALLGTYAAGNSPYGVAYDPVNDAIWIVDSAPSGPGAVTKLRASDGGLVGSYTVAGAGDYNGSLWFTPRGLVVDALHDSIWVANSANSSVSQLDSRTGVVLRKYGTPGGAQPFELAFDGANVWVTLAQGGAVQEMDGSTGLTAGRYTVGAGPRGIAFDSVHGSVWVVNRDAGTISRVNVADGALVATYPVGALPYGIAFDGEDLWITNTGENTVMKLTVSPGYVAVSPAVSVSPPAGIKGTLFEKAGAGFTPNGAATVYLRKPDGAISSGTMIADATGRLEWAFRSSTEDQLGTFATWAIDEGSGATSNTASFSVTAPVAPVTTVFAAGAGPIGIAYDAGTGSVWVANYNENTVTKFRVSDGARVGTYAVGTNPVGVASDPVHQAVWVTNYGSHSVSKLDAATGAVLGTYAAGNSPFGVAYDALNDAIWIVDSVPSGQGAVTKLRASDGGLVGSYTVAGSGDYNALWFTPRGIVVDELHDSIWVANSGNSSVSQLDSRTGVVLRKFGTPGGAQPFELAFDGANVWVTLAQGAAVQEMDGSTAVTVGRYTVGAGPRGIAFDPAHRSVWVVNRDARTVSRLNVGDGSVVGTYPVGAAPNGIAFDGASVWVTNTGDNTISRLVP